MGLYGILSPAFPTELASFALVIEYSHLRRHNPQHSPAAAPASSNALDEVKPNPQRGGSLGAREIFLAWRKAACRHPSRRANAYLFDRTAKPCRYVDGGYPTYLRVGCLLDVAAHPVLTDCCGGMMPLSHGAGAMSLRLPYVRPAACSSSIPLFLRTIP